MDPGEIVGALQAWDVDLVEGIPARALGAPPPIVDLAEALVRAREPRLALCLVPLLLRHPDRAGEVAERAAAVAGPPGREMRILYTAAAAAQRCWRTRLAVAGIPATGIPDRFSGELGLPDAGAIDGRLCLRTLDDLPSAWDGVRYAREADVYRIVDLFLAARAHATAR